MAAEPGIPPHPGRGGVGVTLQVSGSEHDLHALEKMQDGAQRLPWGLCPFVVAEVRGGLLPTF